MEEFGYLRDQEEMLPEDFTAVFEIARVLEDPDSALAHAISPVMTISSPSRSRRSSPAASGNRTAT